MKYSLSLIASLLLLLPLLITAAEPRKTLNQAVAKKTSPNSVDPKNYSPQRVGGYEPIKNITEPFYQNLGKFAVDEHNKQAHTHLKFLKVFYGESQVVAGINYKLDLKAANGGLIHSYEAVVFEDLKQKLNLTSFHNI